MQNHFHAETLLKCRAGLQDMQHTHIEAKVGMACSIPCRSKMKPKMSLLIPNRVRRVLTSGTVIFDLKIFESGRTCVTKMSIRCWHNTPWLLIAPNIEKL